MSGEMQESSSVTTVPNDVWFHVCLYLSVKSLYMLRATTRELRETVDSRTVWLSVLADLMRIKPSAYSKQDVEDMSAAELRKASLRIVLVDRAYSSPTLPHREVALFSREDVVGCTQTLLFPGGERLLILRASGSFTIYDISARKTVVDITPTNTPARSQRSTSTARLFPTSLYTGHIVIHLSPPFEFGPGPAVAEQLRVYEYTADSVRHILTEEMPTSVLHFGHAFYHQDGVLSIAQLHLPDANDMSSLVLHLRTFVAGRRDERVLKRFRIDELRPEPNNAHPSWKLEILSSRYLLLQAKRRALLFDVSQSRGHDSTRKLTTLHSIWRSPAEIQLMYLPVQPTPYYYSGHRSFVRVALWAEPATVYFLDVPVTEDLEVGDDIPLSRVELSIPNTGDEDGDTTMFNKMYRGISHGILRLPLYSFHYVSNRPLPRMTIDQEGLWSYSAIRRYGEDESGVTAGCLRLGREDDLQEVRLGNTLQPWKEANKDDEAKELCVDDISGRFVQLKPTYSGLSAVESAGIVLYTLDNIE